MTERAQALEAVLERMTLKKVEQYRVDGYQHLADAVWGFWHDTIREVLRGQPLEASAEGVSQLVSRPYTFAEGVSPQPDESTPDMGHGWFVTVGRWGDSLVTIEEQCLSGKDGLTDEECDLIRGAALHLQSFAGRRHRVPHGWIPTEGCDCDKCTAALKSTPLEPAGASEPPKGEYTEAEMDCKACFGPCGRCHEPMRRRLAAILDRLYGLHVRPGHIDTVLAALQPVEPTPEPPTEAQWGEYDRLKTQAREIERALREAGCPAMPLEQGVRWLAEKDFAAPLPPRPPAVVRPLRYDLVRYGVTWEGQDNQPLLTPMPDGYWTPWHLAVETPTMEPVWRCFHCDMRLTSAQVAREHFGPAAGSGTVCAVLGIKPSELQRLLAGEPTPCVWQVDGWGHWNTSCGRMWTFADEGYTESRIVFCPGCGNPAVFPDQAGSPPLTVER